MQIKPTWGSKMHVSLKKFACLSKYKSTILEYYTFFLIGTKKLYYQNGRSSTDNTKNTYKKST